MVLLPTASGHVECRFSSITTSGLERADGEFRAEMRVAVKRILRKHGYPPDKQERATALVIEQAEQLGLDLQAF
jgi:hypothetical protein